MQTRIYYNKGMQKQSSNLIAFVFIPLIAVLLAAFCTFVWWMVKQFYKPRHKFAPVARVQPQAPVVPYVEPKIADDFPSLPPEVEPEPTSVEVPTSEQPETCPAPAVPVSIKNTRRTKPRPYEQGLHACVQEGVFPCAWEDNTRGPLRQYWLLSATGPVQRGIYDKKGDLIHETIATLGGTVTSYTAQNTTYYFEGGVLVKIRTSPYDNCNFHDWFFVNAAGKQDVCQCAYNQTDCCARSPYKEGSPRTYCEMFPRDRDFCK